MTDSETIPSAGPVIRRVNAVVALRLLEAMRDMDLPTELLGDENPTQTIPRRFGLSDVVERQIRKYQEDVKNRICMSDEELKGLFRLVIRRPDGPQVCHTVGRLLGGEATGPRWVLYLPEGLQHQFLRRRVRKLLRHLFGRTVGGFARGQFVIEGRSSLFLQADPGGHVCQLLSGLSEEVISRTLGGDARVRHTLCQGLGDNLCRWEAELTL